MPLPELSEDEWIENPAEAGEEASLCTVGEGSDIAEGVQILRKPSPPKVLSAFPHPFLASPDRF